MDTTLNGSKFPPTENPEADKVWVYGKANPGWYVGRWKWNEIDAQRWDSKGYEVQRSNEKPTKRQMTIAEVYGEIEIK
jgi:hypothetical protein